MFPRYTVHGSPERDKRLGMTLNKNVGSEAKNRGNSRKMGIFLRFLIKKSTKNLHVSIIYLKFAADFV